MMRKLNNLNVLVLLILTMWAPMACKDDYSEKDFIEDQNANLEAKKNALKEDITTLASFILQLVDAQTGEGIPDLDVSLESGDGSLPFATTTDMNGNAKFIDLSTGGYTILVTGTDYIDLTATIYFYDNSVTYTENGDALVKRRNESARIIMTPQIGSIDHSELATIRGKVTAELDLTNSTPEIPQNLRVSMALPQTGVAGENKGPQKGYLSATSIAGTQGYGTATIDSTTGEYTVQVPVTNSSIELLFPDFVADQTMAYTELNDLELDQPVLGKVRTGFGGNYEYNAIPYVPGVKAVFPTPPEVAGKGVTFKVTQTDGSPLVSEAHQQFNAPGQSMLLYYYEPVKFH